MSANYYSDAKSQLGFHSDNEFLFQADKQASCIVSVSFGATPEFVIRDKRTRAEIPVKLSHGDLLTIEGLMQKFYEHCIVQSAVPVDYRINLTFRKIGVHNDGCALARS